ncbi:TIGR00725 family protein [candidate division GN15 bacterium]|uniref:TIGR00725 family protein n=1 Tax=candidate division GN15 bacterium TaxID=2072418 RepID=A0A855X7K6_9BACT|nr:MAG: TIGR00725 family protein [candidate division GN15 bacterium]
MATPKQSNSRKPVIAVIGAGKCSKKMRDAAAEVGRYVAEHGGLIVCGGLGGVMEGAARGAREAGGTVIGIIPGDSAAEANEFVDLVIPTGMGEARNILVIRTADAVVAFPGKYGTLTEMAFARLFDKPLVSVQAWKLGEEVIQVEDATEAAKLALELASK